MKHLDDRSPVAGESEDDGRKPWFALRVKSNFEKVVALHLQSRGCEEYVPTYRCSSVRSGTIERPLFPGYVFCRFHWSRRLPVLTIPGIVSIVGIGGVPQCVDEREIEAVRAVAASASLVGPWPFLKEGQRVVIERGPLAGVEGVLLRAGNGYRLVVSITLLRRAIAAEVDRETVRPVGPALDARVNRETRGPGGRLVCVPRLSLEGRA